MSEILSILQNKQSDGSATSRVGAEGERLAMEFLLEAGFRLVLSNFKTPVGRAPGGAIINGEIDLIAYDRDELCFIEVKTRSSDKYASPLAAVDLRKQRQIIRTARQYRKIFHLMHAPVRYDVVTIVLDGGSRPKIELFKNYFNEAKFRKTYPSDNFS